MIPELSKGQYHGLNDDDRDTANQIDPLVGDAIPWKITS